MTARLSILGRLDFQVKLRGYRIELGEIETAHRASPGRPRDAWSLCARTCPGTRAWWPTSSPPNPPRRPGRATARAPARSPARIHGAVCIRRPRRAAAYRQRQGRSQGAAGARALRPRDRTAYVAPRTPTEEILAGIWAELLNTPKVGVTDNFFDLGGNSLLVLRMLTRLEAGFGVRPRLSIIMVAPTIDKLSKQLHENASNHKSSNLVSLRASGTKPPLFCLHPASGHLIRYMEMAAALDEDQPVYGVQAPDMDAIEQWTSVEELALEYYNEIRRVQSHGPYYLCGLSFGGLLAYEIATRLVDEGEEVGAVALFDAGNTAYYRNLPALQWMQFRLTYLFDRCRKYALNLIYGLVDHIAKDVWEFLRSRTEFLVVGTIRRLFLTIDRPMPKIAQDPIIVFNEMGRVYTPRPFSGQLLLFRAEGRTAEYGADITLGWKRLARTVSRCSMFREAICP